jgi:glycosyltransferase involved in cell wall biosynthesis
VRIALVSEVFPPRAGGAGWSTRALALGLSGAGHEVEVLTTSPGPADLDGLRIRRLEAGGRKRFRVPAAFDRALRDARFDVVHAQHSLSALGALRAGREPHCAVTIRDHWPVCFWSTRLSRGRLCPACGILPMTRCVEGRVGAPAPIAWGALPYMGWDLAVKRRALGRAGACLAVSEAVAAELRAAGLARVEVLPNMVDAEEARAVAAAEPPFPLPERFLVFVGKLEANKGAHLLLPAVAGSRAGLPLVVLGEGSLHHELKLEAARHGIEILVRGWAHRDDALRILARATALVFPSLWPEPLSRVLLEAIALGTPIAAMDTGGTREILEDGASGLLVRDAAGLGEAVARLVSDPALRRRIGDGARERARAFAPEVLVPRYEDVYRRLR